MKKILILLAILPVLNFAKLSRLTCDEAKKELNIIENETKKIKQAEQDGYLARFDKEFFVQTKVKLIQANKLAQNKVKKACN